eukprot:GSChrysophyteH1.ASY1.ANO1.2252.1 assembled CDS
MWRRSSQAASRYALLHGRHRSSLREGKQTDPNSSSHKVNDAKKIGNDQDVLELADAAADLVKAVAPSYGVFNTVEKDDIDQLLQNYTVPALARALREREVTLQRAAALMQQGDMNKLRDLLRPFEASNVLIRRHRDHSFDITEGFHRNALVVLQRYLHRMPREVFHSSNRRASVVIPLCNVHGVPSILFERRSKKVKTHKQQVCFPGGMVDEGVDATIIQTSLREMEEELGIAEVAGMTGVAVTPVVGFIGELSELHIRPDADEVEQVFSIPLKDLLDDSKWTHKEFSTPAFHGGPFVIWGLTAYLLHRFLSDVVKKCEVAL